MTNKSVTLEEFEKNKLFYSNTACQIYWTFFGIPVATRKQLNNLFKEYFGKNLPRIKGNELDKIFNFIKIIRKPQKNENQKNKNF